MYRSYIHAIPNLTFTVVTMRACTKNTGSCECDEVAYLVIFWAFFFALALVILSIKCKYVIIVSIWVRHEMFMRKCVTIAVDIAIQFYTHTHTRCNRYMYQNVRCYLSPPLRLRHRYYDTYRLKISVADDLAFMMTRIIHGRYCITHVGLLGRNIEKIGFFFARKKQSVLNSFVCVYIKDGFIIKHKS